MTVVARQAVRPPQPTKRSLRREIVFRHPGYPEPSNVLLQLHASDEHSDGDDDLGHGLHAQFALDACGIVAGNRWDGWLSESREQAATQIDPNTVLRRRGYYFHLPQSSSSGAPYSVVPNFSEWRFPHDALPPHWQAITPAPAAPDERTFAASTLNNALYKRDVSCRITGCQEGTEVAHICPKSEREWWVKNGMSVYTISTEQTLNHPENALLLRSDLHTAFDDSKLAFVPKPSGNGGHCLVVQAFKSSPELEHLYHNRELQPIRCSVELLFARFAWSVFPRLGAFLQGPLDRRLRLWVHTSAEEGTLFGESGCAAFRPKAMRGRSESPKKRKPNTDPEDAHADDIDSIGDRSPKRPRASSSHTTQQLSSSFSSAPSLSSPELKPKPEPLALPSLREMWLQRESLRSDTQRTWERDKEWAEEVWNGKSLDAEEAQKFFEICGVEVLDNEADN